MLLVSTLAVLSTAFLMIMAADVRIGMSHHQSTQLQYTIESAIEIASYEISLDPTIAIPADSTVPIFVDSMDFGKFEIYSYPDSLGTPHIRQLRMRASTDKAWSDLFWEALIPTQDPRAYFPISANRSLYIASGSKISGGKGVLVSRDATLAINDSVGALVITPPFSDYQPDLLLSDVWPYQYTVSGDPTIYQAQVIPQDKFLSFSPSEQTRLSGLVNPRSIVVDAAGGKMYWAEPGSSWIRRADLDGSNIEDLINVGDARGLALDMIADKLYYLDRGNDRIRRADLDGSSIETLFTGQPDLTGLALDVPRGKMYWLDRNQDQMRRANMDGSGSIEILVTGTTGPRDIAVDSRRGKVYWTDSDSRLIQRCNLDGTEVETILSGTGDSRGIEIDPIVGKIYWTDRTARRIYRADLDGTNVEVLISSNVDRLEGIALDFNSDFSTGTADRIYWTDEAFDWIRRARVNTLTLRPNEATNPMGIFVWNSSGTGYYWSQSPYWHFLGVDGTIYCTAQNGLFVTWDIGFRVAPRVHNGPGGPERYPAIVTKGNYYNWLGIRDVLDGYVYVNDWFYNNATDDEMTINGALAGGDLYCWSPITVNYDSTLVTQQAGPLSDPTAIYPTILLKRRRFYVLPYGGS
jgi:DNA-binding beta-propeller fold protein YncE